MATAPDGRPRPALRGEREGEGRGPGTCCAVWRARGGGTCGERRRPSERPSRLALSPLPRGEGIGQRGARHGWRRPAGGGAAQSVNEHEHVNEQSHVSRLTSRVSRLTSHVSRLTSHVSRLSHVHAQRLTSHVSARLTSHVSLSRHVLHVLVPKACSVLLRVPCSRLRDGDGDAYGAGAYGEGGAGESRYSARFTAGRRCGGRAGSPRRRSRGRGRWRPAGSCRSGRRRSRGARSPNRSKRVVARPASSSRYDGST